MNHKKTSLYLFLSISLTLFLFACSESSNDQSSNKSSSKTTNKIQGPKVQFDQNLVKLGKKQYQQNCVFCHQADAIGKPGVAPSLTNKEFLSIASYQFLYATIEQGRKGTGMPPFKHLGDSNIKAIISFLRSHSTLPSRIKTVNSQDRSQGDPRLGKLFFDQICSTCHGPKGSGYLAGGTGTAVGLKGFLDTVSDGFLRVTIAEGRSNTRMYGFKGPAAMANLSDKEIDDIISYLRTSPGEK